MMIVVVVVVPVTMLVLHQSRGQRRDIPIQDYCGAQNTNSSTRHFDNGGG